VSENLWTARKAFGDAPSAETTGVEVLAQPSTSTVAWALAFSPFWLVKSASKTALPQFGVRCERALVPPWSASSNDVVGVFGRLSNVHWMRPPTVATTPISFWLIRPLKPFRSTMSLGIPLSVSR